MKPTVILLAAALAGCSATPIHYQDKERPMTTSSFKRRNKHHRRPRQNLKITLDKL